MDSRDLAGQSLKPQLIIRNRMAKHGKFLSVNQKLEIIKYAENNKLQSHRSIAKHFQAKYNRPMHHSSIQQILKRRLIISASPAKNVNEIRVKNEIVQGFEKELLREMHDVYQRANLTAEIGKGLAHKIQRSAKYDNTDVRKMRFCSKTEPYMSQLESPISSSYKNTSVFV